MKVPNLILGGLFLLSAQAFSQTDTTKKTPEDTTTKKDFNYVAKGAIIIEDNILISDTVPEKKDTTTKRDTSKWIAYNVMDTVPEKKDTVVKKDTSKWVAYNVINNKKDFSFNDVAKGPFWVEDSYMVLDTIPTDTTKNPRDTTKKSSGWGSLAPIPQSEPLTEFKPSAQAHNAGNYYVAILGNYQPANANTTEPSSTSSNVTNTTGNVSITVDDQNPGKIWVEGIGANKFYAYLKNESNIYKIPAQKVGDSKVEEGIVAYDEASKQVHIRIGSGYNDADPQASLNTTEATMGTVTGSATDKPSNKGKSVAHTAKKPVKKIISFDGNKTDVGTASLPK